MTWSKFYTQTYTDGNSNNSFYTYLFNTALPLRGWTVSNHPSGSQYKRSLKYTAVNWWTGSSDTMYLYADWSYTSNPYCAFYADKTFTTVPGDLGTSNVAYQNLHMSPFTANWTFWQSSENPNALLVLQNKKIVFYWPGMTQWGRYNSGTTASALNESTYIYPGGASGWYISGAPMGSTPSGNQTGYLLPANGSSQQTNRSSISPDYLVKGIIVCASSQSYLYGESDILFSINQIDTKLFLPKAKTGFYNYFWNTSTTTNGILIYDGSNYHYSGWSDLSYSSLWFNMGTSEPVFS